MPDSDSYEETDDEMKVTPSHPLPPANSNQMIGKAPRSPSPEKFCLKKVKVEALSPAKEISTNPGPEVPRSPSPVQISLRQVKVEVSSPPPPPKSSLKKVKSYQIDEDLVKYFEHMDEYYVWSHKSEMKREEEIYERKLKYEEKLNRQRILEELEKQTRPLKVKKRARDMSSDDEKDKPTRKLYRTRVRQRRSKLGVNDIFGADISSSDGDSSEEHSSREALVPAHCELNQISSSEEDDMLAKPDKPRIQTEESLPLTEVQLKEAMLTRSQLARIVHAPFFSEVVTGAYVIVRVGKMKNLPPTIIAEVVKVMHSAKVYDLENTRTDKTMTIRFGNFVGNFRLMFVSGSLNFENGLFEEFLKRATDMRSVPDVDTIMAKKKQIHEAMTHRYTNQEIDKMMAEKKRFNKLSQNRGTRKSELLNRLRFAKENGIEGEIRRLEEEVNKLDQNENCDATERKEIRSNLLETIISRREMGYGLGSRHSDTTATRTPNFSKMDDDDPFTRKKLRGRVATGSRSRTDVTDESMSPKEENIVGKHSVTAKFDYFKLYEQISFDFNPGHHSQNF